MTLEDDLELGMSIAKSLLASGAEPGVTDTAPAQAAFPPLWIYLLQHHERWFARQCWRSLPRGIKRPQPVVTPKGDIHPEVQHLMHDVLLHLQQVAYLSRRAEGQRQRGEDVEYPVRNMYSAYVACVEQVRSTLTPDDLRMDVESFIQKWIVRVGGKRPNERPPVLRCFLGSRIRAGVRDCLRRDDWIERDTRVTDPRTGETRVIRTFRKAGSVDFDAPHPSPNPSHLGMESREPRYDLDEDTLAVRRATIIHRLVMLLPRAKSVSADANPSRQLASLRTVRAAVGHYFLWLSLDDSLPKLWADFANFDESRDPYETAATIREQLAQQSDEGTRPAFQSLIESAYGQPLERMIAFFERQEHSELRMLASQFKYSHVGKLVRDAKNGGAVAWWNLYVREFGEFHELDFDAFHLNEQQKQLWVSELPAYQKLQVLFSTDRIHSGEPPDDLSDGGSPMPRPDPKIPDLQFTPKQIQDKLTQPAQPETSASPTSMDFTSWRDEVVDTIEEALSQPGVLAAFQDALSFESLLIPRTLSLADLVRRVVRRVSREVNGMVESVEEALDAVRLAPGQRVWNLGTAAIPLSAGNMTVTPEVSKPRSSDQVGEEIVTPASHVLWFEPADGLFLELTVTPTPFAEKSVAERFDLDLRLGRGPLSHVTPITGAVIVVQTPGRERRLKTNLTGRTFVASLPPAVDLEVILPETTAVTEGTLVLEGVKLDWLSVE